MQTLLISNKKAKLEKKITGEPLHFSLGTCYPLKEQRNCSVCILSEN